MKRVILVIEDDQKTAELIRLYLEKDGYHVYMSYDGHQGLKIARAKHVDLIVLDLMLPSIDGLDICRILRSETNVPILMLTARSTEDDILLGLDLGADDYMTKPFSPRELIARIRSVLRRSIDEKPKGPNKISYGDLLIDFTGHEVRTRGEVVKLTPKEFTLLEILTTNPGRAYSRGELLETAFGFDYEGLERTIDVHIMNLRKKIEPDPDRPTYIQTVYGIGYKFVEAMDAT
jgi:DNA-binding response OmpR family regulator